MKLIQHVAYIRGLIEKSFDNRFEHLGLMPNGLVDVSGLTLPQEKQRNRLVDILKNHLNENKGYQDARKATLNECVFTLFNRIAALKVMEDKELFPPVIRRRVEHGNLSFSHNAWLEQHPEERCSVRQGLKHFLTGKFEELGSIYPLYRKDYPYSLLPTADELFQITEAFNAVEDDSDCGSDVWKGDDILGWLYENFNAAEKIEFKDSGEKVEYDKVSLQSQVYTPQWVVKFLVDNTLGKLYLEMFPDSQFIYNEQGEVKYLIANAPNQSSRKPKKIEEIKLIDPACGSGNFLIYAFSVFYDIYLNQIEQYGADYEKRDIPKLIVENNLYGVDLDERAVQLTQIALFIKARQVGGRRCNMPRFTNVVSTHFVLPDNEDVLRVLTDNDGWDSVQKRTVRQIWKDLCNAYKFGSLIRVEEQLKAIEPQPEDIGLFKESDFDDLFSIRNTAVEMIRSQVEKWSDRGANPYTMVKNNDAITFLEILSKRFDVAVANPPYTDSSDFGNELKEFVENNYRRPLKFNINLYACFIKRCCELAADDGKVGLIHPHTFMFIKTFEDVRKFMLEKTHVNVMVDYGLDRVNLFGPGILLDATFYTLDLNSDDTTNGIYFNITANQQEKYKKDSLAQAFSDYCNNISNDRVYALPQSKLKGIKSWPFIYWISDEFREKFGGKTVDDYIDVVKGLTTSDNNRFLRFWWEIPHDKISDNYKIDHKKWVRYVKGGPFNKWYGNMWTLLNWENNGYEIKHFVDEKGSQRSVVRNESYYFTEGLTYSAAGSKGITFRYLPSNYIIDAGGPGVYMNSYKDVFYSLSFLNSVLSYYVCDCLNPTVNTNQGDLWRIPFVLPDKSSETISANLAKQNIEIKKHICSYSLIEENYNGSPISKEREAAASIYIYFIYENALLTQLLLNEAVINRIVFDIYGLNNHDRKMVLDKEGVPVGSLPVSAEAKEAYRQWMSTNTEFAPSEELLQHIETLPISDRIERIDDFEVLYQQHNDWEEFCIRHNCNPIEAWHQHKQQGVLPPQRTQVLAFELLTDVIRTVLEKDNDGIIPITERSGEEILASRIEKEMISRGYSPTQVAQVFTLLGCPLEQYLKERFFQQLSNHLNLFMYLPKTPFIWHITSGIHHAIEVYVSIYKWNRDNLYRLKSVYCSNRETILKDRLENLSGGDALAMLEYEEIQEQLKELKTFVQKIDNLLESGYDPKLDDGVGKNIAPLQQRGMLAYEVLNAGQLKKYLNADW